MCRYRYGASLNSDIPRVMTDIPKVIKMKSRVVGDHEGKEKRDKETEMMYCMHRLSTYRDQDIFQEEHK